MQNYTTTTEKTKSEVPPTFTFWTDDTRIPFILSSLPNAKVIDTDDVKHLSKIEVTIVNGAALLLLFHAGIDCGMSLYSSKKQAA